MGIPVVATNVGGPAEIVRDGVDGVLLAPRDHRRWTRAVAELLDDPGLRGRMGASGRERARTEFAPSVHGRLVRQIYERVLSGAA
jgi:glycosyltransferase involved in cell wall biosynthesis